jgi:hypothetical protein
MDRAIGRIPIENLVDPLVYGNRCSLVAGRHVGERECVEIGLARPIEMGKLVRQAALLGFAFRAGVVSDERYDLGWRAQRCEQACAIQRVESGLRNRLGVSDVVKPCRGCETVVKAQLDGEFLGQGAYAADVRPPVVLTGELFAGEAVRRFD